jgi:hypothetical protein
MTPAAAFVGYECTVTGPWVEHTQGDSTRSVLEQTPTAAAAATKFTKISQQQQ